MKKILMAFTVVAMLAISLSANATAYYLYSGGTAPSTNSADETPLIRGDHGSISPVVASSFTEFKDTYSFTLASNALVSFSANSLTLRTGNSLIYNIDNMFVTLTDTTTGVIGSPSFGPNISAYDNLLNAGDNYKFTVIGDANGYDGGLYTFAWAVSVPLPAAAWLFGSGLIGLVGVGARKTKQ